MSLFEKDLLYMTNFVREGTNNGYIDENILNINDDKLPSLKELDNYFESLVVRYGIPFRFYIKDCNGKVVYYREKLKE